MPRHPGNRIAMTALLTGVGVLMAACGQSVSGTATPAADGPACPAKVLLAVDVSLSMEATDVAPSRWTVARRAATDFAQRLPAGTALGLVTFAGTASVQVMPTIDRAAFTGAFDRVRLAERTATGEGIFTGLSAIYPPGELTSVPGARQIILLSDGKQTVPAGLDEPRGAFTAARAAKDVNIAISTISLGTAGGVVEVPAISGGADKVPVPTDPDSLREIARLSGGDFHTASSLAELDAALADLTCHT
ncbi:VWA domain-containing protein [Nocardia asteroides]|uniref:VWA domain-containing protein n=1 Tax=Nocardia asteroides TaxID=1824 RepID=UPI00340F3DFD